MGVRFKGFKKRRKENEKSKMIIGVEYFGICFIDEMGEKWAGK